MELVEIRDLDGPNLFTLRPAIKLEVVVSPDERVPDERLKCASRLAGRPLDARPLPALSAVLGALHEQVGLPAPEIGHRQMDRAGHHVLFFPWQWRSSTVAIAKLAYDLLGSDEVAPAALDEIRRYQAFDQAQGDRPGWIRDDARSVPTVGITGTNGKTTTTRLVAHIASRASRRAGWCSSTGVYIDGEQIEAGDYSGPSGARLVLSNPDVEIAVLETARGGILLRGVGYESNDAGVMLNVTPDHLGLHGVDRLETLAEVKSVVVQVTCPDGLVILNADDPLVLAQRERVRAEILLFSQAPANPAVADHCAAGGCALIAEAGWIVLRDGQERQPIMALSDAPMTYGGAARHMVENALAACGAALGLGFNLDHVVSGLRSFHSNTRGNAGRLNVFNLDGRAIIIDYAHNESGLTALLGFARTRVAPGGTLAAIIGTAGDRDDASIRGLGRIAGTRADRVLLKETGHHLRGRELGETIELMRSGVADVDAVNRLIGAFPDEHAAVIAALDNSQPGDVIAVMCVQDQDAVLHELRQRGAQECS